MIKSTRQFMQWKDTATFAIWKGQKKELMNNYCCVYSSYKEEKKLYNFHNTLVKSIEHHRFFSQFHFSPLVQSTTRKEPGVIEHVTPRTLFSMRSACYTWMNLKPCKVTQASLNILHQELFFL